jgi:hypothetical protein
LDVHNRDELNDLFLTEESLPLVWISQAGNRYSNDAPYHGELFVEPALGMVTAAGEPVVSWLHHLGSATLLHNYAKLVIARIPDAQVFHITTTTTPDAAWVEEWDEHFFAVVDDRWLVDPALWHLQAGVVGDAARREVRVGNQLVFDLHDPCDQTLAAQLYGDRASWRRGVL